MKDEGKMRAVASVTFDGCFVVHDIKIIDGQNGMFLAMPSRKMAEDDFRDIAHPLNSFTRDMIKEAVFDAYDRALREEMNKSDEDAERIAAKFF
jgi:stage V sporulation protein G